MPPSLVLNLLTEARFSDDLFHMVYSNFFFAPGMGDPFTPAAPAFQRTFLGSFHPRTRDPDRGWPWVVPTFLFLMS